MLAPPGPHLDPTVGQAVARAQPSLNHVDDLQLVRVDELDKVFQIVCPPHPALPLASLG